MDNFFKYLEDLCNLNGGSGDEGAVRDYIQEVVGRRNEVAGVKSNLICKTDPLGNLFVTDKNSNPKIILAAHMDEVSMIITYIRDDGMVNIAPVGGIDARAAIGRQVRVGGKIGVIGSRAVHNMSQSDKEKKPSFSKLYLDIGADKKEIAQGLVELGDRVYFDTKYSEFGQGFIKAKAIDDRFGCALLLSLLESGIGGFSCLFTTQEEVGLRGASTALFDKKPEYAIVVEATTAADIPSVSDEKKCCLLGGGAVVPFMDRSTIYNRELYDLSKKLAEENNIKRQTKTVIAGGNDAGAIHKANGGIKTISISAPCRYLHSPTCVVQKSDLEDCFNLAKNIITDLKKGNVLNYE